MKSKTTITTQSRRKSNSQLVGTIRAAVKSDAWNVVAAYLTSPRRKRIEVNLDKLTKDSVVPGKVLSQGTASKVKVVAFSFSSKAKEKLEKAGGKAVLIVDEIKSNPDMKGLEVVR